MAGPLLETKLYVPGSRLGLVPRPRLSERLDRGAASTLMIVSAPAGFGKTTLLTQWLATASGDGQSVAWPSLDPRDNDPALFWTYLVTALAKAAPEAVARSLSLMQSPQPPIEAFLSTLLNDLASVSSELLLVLDDYHVIEARDVQDGMAFLLAHLPPQLHVVIASRADPAFPLARLRARGELVEIRAADLRFTPDEAAVYLNEVMGVALTVQDVAALEERTEGWVAALQLAALSMQGRNDIAGFIAGFAGNDRYIVDYLVEEVLQRQPEPVRSFLLQTSILSRLSGSLCDAVTGQAGGKAVLEALERGNMFLVTLDDRRTWYRYHHLFADVLQARLMDEHPDWVAELHARASKWFERNGDLSEAIGHAMAAENVERAADLLELGLPALRQGRQDRTIRHWLEALPDELIRARPVLSVGYAGALMVRGEVDGVEERLRDAERWLVPVISNNYGPPVASAEMVVVDEHPFHGLPGAIEMYRAGVALLTGDVAGTMTHARIALDVAGEDNHLGRGSSMALLGLACWTSGDLEAARQWYAEAMTSLVKAGHISDAIGCAIALADIRVTQGRLRAAMSTYEWALGKANEQGGPPLRGAADMHVGMAQLFIERNDLEAAKQHLLISRDLGEHAGLPQNRYRWRVAMARIREVDGDLDGSRELLNEAEHLYVGDFSPNVRPVPALTARVQVARGALGDADGWVRERGLSAVDDLSYVREFEHITLARVLLAQQIATSAERSFEEATGLLERLLAAAEAGARTGSVIEILVLQALAHQRRRDFPAALASLHRALTLAEAEDYVRTFVDECPLMAILLRVALKKGIAPSYVRRLLAATNKAGDSKLLKQGLIEPLSNRELDVLRLLGTDLDGPAIARELSVSLNTLRTHTKNIYIKLGANNRRTAVRRAVELDLLSRSRGR